MTPVPWSRFWWVLGVMLVLLAAYVCLAPNSDIPGAFEFNDKLSHVAGHLALTSYFCGLVPRARWFKVAAWMLAFGLGIELAQQVMHLGRQADRYDIMANTAGMVAGLVVSHFGLCRWPHWVAWVVDRRTVH